MAGTLSFYAGLVETLRPFLDSFWAALSRGAKADANPTAGGGIVRLRQIRIALAWFIAFFSHTRGSLERVYPLRDVAPPTQDIPLVCVDASPWGIGGFISTAGAPTRYFCDQITDDDCKTFSARTGLSEFNTTWEALAVLVAIKLWAPRSGRWLIRIKSDSLSTLLAVSDLKAKSPGLSPCTLR